DERWQSVRDVRVQLAWVAEEGPASASMPAGAPARRGARIAWVAAGVLLVALVGTVAALVLRRPTVSTESTQFVLLPPESTRFASEPMSHAISPDGRRIAFIARGANGRSLLWVRSIDSIVARSLPGTEDAT